MEQLVAPAQEKVGNIASDPGGYKEMSSIFANPMRGMGEGEGAGFQPMSTAVHIK